MLDPKLYYILIPIILAAILNVLIFTKRWNNIQRKYLPPGWVIGVIWTIILGILGYLLFISKQHKVTYFAIAGLILFILAYPFLTNKFVENTKLLDTITLILSVLVATLLFFQKGMVLYMLPLLAWVVFIKYTDSYYEKKEIM
jgi:tryptophan-rich sensory protein